MENALWTLVILVGLGGYAILDTINRLRTDVSHLSRNLAEAIRLLGYVDVLDMRSRDAAADIYLLRRIAEEQTGTSKDAIYALDKQSMEAKFKHLKELLEKRDAAKDEQ